MARARFLVDPAHAVGEWIPDRGAAELLLAHRLPEQLADRLAATMHLFIARRAPRARAQDVSETLRRLAHAEVAGEEVAEDVRAFLVLAAHRLAGAGNPNASRDEIAVHALALLREGRVERRGGRPSDQALAGLVRGLAGLWTDARRRASMAPRRIVGTRTMYASIDPAFAAFVHDVVRAVEPRRRIAPAHILALLNSV